MVTTWIGSRRVGFILAGVQDPNYDPVPNNWVDQVRERVFFDLDPVTRTDRSLRHYIHTISYGRAQLEADIIDIVSVAPCDINAAIEASARSNLYDFIGIVFTANRAGCTGWADYGGHFPFNPPRSPNRLVGWFRVNMGETLGVWAMEMLHVVTGFGDLYLTAVPPGPFDEMSCACGTHPSVFTKLKLGWLDPTSIAQATANWITTFTLHAVSLLQPPPPGRFVAVTVPARNSPSYFIIEARVALDPYENATPGTSTGIPRDGVVVYLANEAVWAPLTLETPFGLGPGDTYANATEQMEIRVDRAEPGGFAISISSTENVQCAGLREGIAGLEVDLATLQEELQTAASNDKPRIARDIREAKAKLTTLRAQATQLGCRSD